VAVFTGQGAKTSKRVLLKKTLFPKPAGETYANGKRETSSRREEQYRKFGDTRRKPKKQMGSSEKKNKQFGADQVLKKRKKRVRRGGRLY